jgi:demethylspheroidene O-methyltransferase
MISPWRASPPDLGSWSERWFAQRNRWLASRGFQRWASGFPLTRWIARRRARAVFDLVAGFGLTDEAARRLLAAAVSLKLVEPRPGDRYGLGVLGAPLVGNRGITAMVTHHAALYADLRDPLALLRGTANSAALAGYWPYAEAESSGQSRAVAPNQVAAYSALMSASQPLVADEILDAYPLARHRCLLDIGGGEGNFLAAAAARAPALQLMLFDLPAVARRAHLSLAAQGLGGRAQITGGDFLNDALPRGADIASLVRVVHDHDDREALALLRAARAALPDDGVLLLAEPMSDTPGAEPMGDAYFGFYLLAMGRGRPRRAEELIELLRQAGFERARLLPNRMPLQTRVMLAHCRKP